MKKMIGFVVSIVVPAFIMLGGMASSAVAQEKAAKAVVKPKVLLENAKVRVFETTSKPGDENTSVPSSSPRVLRVLKGGTTLYTYADGKKETMVYKTGEVRFVEPTQGFTTKNIGKTELQLYVVQLK